MIRQRKEPWFQGLWAVLHLTAAILHIGSAIYHARRTRRKGSST